VVNPITTILRAEVGEIVDPSLQRLKQLVIDECLSVASAEGISLKGDLLAEIDAAYQGSHNIVSMRQDILRGRPTEIDYLNGAVASLGRRHALSCPVNEGLASIIKGMELCSDKPAARDFLPDMRRTSQK
jgi:2-dehydropantoate 2-reductase